MTFKTLWPICETCRAMPSAVFKHNSELSHFVTSLWPSFTSFLDSALAGCHTCFLFYSSIREPFKTRLSRAATPIPLYLESVNGAGKATRNVVLAIDITSLPDRSEWPTAILPDNCYSGQGFTFSPIADVKYTFDEREIPDNSKRFRGLLSLYPQDEGAKEYIRQSLKVCLEEHKKSCNRVMWPRGSTTARSGPGNAINVVSGDKGLVTAPTRLVYVGSESPNDGARIVDGHDCLYRGGYIALSYCWGFTPKDAHWLLTESRMARFADSISLDDLPMTLHDALMWTRQLGLHYVWIDSMCIIQDSRDDWQREAANMSSIYGSSTMTLVAASTSVYGGMTDRQNPLRNCAASLALDDANSQQIVYILGNGQRPSQPPPAPTDFRGWCYQEDLLSSRLVKCTQSQTEWLCLADARNPRGSEARRLGLGELSSVPVDKWYINWYQFVEHYTNKRLSYPTDRLIALHGIAGAKAVGGYHAGLLERDPWASLLWCRDENQTIIRPGKRFTEYIAPSWSWASVDAPILFYEAKSRQWRKPQLEVTQHDPELHSVEVQAASKFDTGAVKGGNIDFSAYVCTAYTAAVEPFLFNTKHGSYTYGRRNLRSALNGDIIGLIIFDVATEARDNMLLCCALLHISNVSHWEENGTAGLGLAFRIQRCSQEDLVCSRVGYVQFTAAFSKSCQRRRLRIV